MINQNFYWILICDPRHFILDPRLFTLDSSPSTLDIWPSTKIQTPRGESKHRLPKLTRILLSLVLSNDFVFITDLNYWIKLLSCIIEANGGHIGLSHINLHWYYWGSRRGFYRFRLLVGMDKHCVNEISFTNNFCFFLNLPVNNELGIVQDGRHEFIIKCFKPSQNH